MLTCVLYAGRPLSLAATLAGLLQDRDDVLLLDMAEQAAMSYPEVRALIEVIAQHHGRSFYYVRERLLNQVSSSLYVFRFAKELGYERACLWPEDFAIEQGSISALAGVFESCPDAVLVCPTVVDVANVEGYCDWIGVPLAHPDDEKDESVKVFRHYEAGQVFELEHEYVYAWGVFSVEAALEAYAGIPDVALGLFADEVIIGRRLQRLGKVYVHPGVKVWHLATTATGVRGQFAESSLRGRIARAFRERKVDFVSES